MFCVHCGKELPDGTKFCPFCGGEQPPVPGEGPKPEDIIENAGESIGNGIDSAINDLKNSEGAKVLKNTISEAGKKAGNLKENWRDYLTLENMELAAPILLLMPLIMGIVKAVLIRVFGLFMLIPFIGAIFRFAYWLIKFVFVVASGAGLGAAGYVLYKKPEKRQLFGFISLGASALGFLSCVGMMFGWKYVNVIWGLLALVWGVESISRVVLQKKGMETEPDVQADIDAYKNFFEEMKVKYAQEKEKNKAAETAGFTAEETGAESEVKGFSPEAAETAVAVPAGFNAEGKGSYFDGSGIELLGLLLLTMIISGVTCGLAMPWMLCKIFKWRKTHTVIDGRRLDFNGTGGNLFGHWILWEILTAVTCGIYGFFMFVAVRKWEMKHTFYADEPGVEGSFDGNSFQYFGYGVLQGILCLLTLGIAMPWTITMIEKWQMKHSVVSADRMRYDGTGLGLFGQYIIVALLSLVTCGIYLPWGIVRLDKYLFSHVHVDM